MEPVSNSSTQPESDRGSRALFRTSGFVFQVSLLGIFLIVFGLLSYLAPNFLTLGNQFNILRQAASTLIVAVGMTLVITSAGIDLSVGSGLAVVGVLSALCLKSGWPVWLVILSMLALGSFIGAFNGYFVAYQNIPAFIVTLAGLSALRGVAQLITKGYSIPVPPDSAFLTLGRGHVWGIPVPGIIAVVVVVAGYVVLNHTRFGVHVTGIGTNEEAVRRAGVKVRLVTLLVYVISGFVTALGGMISVARLSSGSSYMGVAFELEVIAAVIVGGTDLFGGEGRMLGTIVGTLLIAIIANGLILMNVSPFYKQIIEGVIILFAIWFNTHLSERSYFAQQ